MATAYEWTTYDYASRNVLGALIGNSGYSYRQFEETAGSEMKYSRVRDIALGRRAPVKLSEFLLICDVCDADPVQTLRDIIAEAQRIEEKERLKQAIPPAASAAPPVRSAADVSDLADRIAAHPEEFDLMASTDPNKENEMNTPRE